MGLFEAKLQCGCIVVTSTLDSPTETHTKKYCEEHKPPPKEKKKRQPKSNGKDEEMRNPPTNSNGDTS
jgi:hypothetical protein